MRFVDPKKATSLLNDWRAPAAFRAFSFTLRNIVATPKRESRLGLDKSRRPRVKA